MNKKIAFMIGVVAVIVAFYGGTLYGKSSVVGMAAADRQARMTQGGGSGGQRGMRGAQGGFVSGKIVSKDAQSMVISPSSGGSKIIFFSPSTQVMKTIAGSPSDLVIGEEVSTNGTPNTDGSVNAQIIQIRPVVKATQ